MQHHLWYNSWSENYIEGLPMGNGRLAVMALGRPDNLRLAVNHEWMWRGENRGRDFDDVSSHLPEVREQLVKGNFAEGTLLANEYFGGSGGVRSKKNRVDPYQPVGDVHVSGNFGEIGNYKRTLDLDTGLCTIEFDGICGHVTERIFVSSTAGCAVVRVETEKPASIKLTMSRIEDDHCTLSFENACRGVRMNGRFMNGIRFAAENAVSTDGRHTIGNGAVNVEDATDTLMFIQAGTDAKGTDPAEELTFPASRDFDELFDEHVKRFATLKGNAVLDVDVPDSNLPTNERIAAFRAGGEPAMPLLYFEYGRYLMASGSSGELPLNLQGKWSEDLSPAWEADYHLDVNLEMCYWFVETLGMSEVAAPLFNLIERYIPHGREMAKKLYGCSGTLFCIQTDVWGRMTPESYGWAVWIGAAPWLAHHMFMHWRYTRDRKFLKERCYPFIKEVSAFYRDYLTEHDGRLWIVPSQSPENKFVGSGDLPVSICVNSAMDIELATDTLNAAIECAEELSADTDLIPVWRDMLDRLAGLSIDSTGRLNEWDKEREEHEPGHRHVSHLYGLYPSELFKPGSDLWKAAERSLDARMKHGGGHTGWSRAWVACLMARLGRAEEAWEHFIHLIGDFTTDSLLDTHPPRIFQIDGNMGGTACVCEMLLQSRKDELILLPALPKAWPKGSVKNFRAQNGVCVDFSWNNGTLCSCTLTADHEVRLTVVTGSRRIPAVIKSNEPLILM